VFEDMKTSLMNFAGAITLCASLVLPVQSHAANFQVDIKRLSVSQCGMTGSMLNIDPSTGNVSIDLDADFVCYPLVVSSIANNASLSVTSPTTIGGGTTGQGSVNLQINTGLSVVTPGVTCVADGYTSSNVNISSGWSATPALCGPSNCGATATRTVNVVNPSATLDGNITFKAKCTYQDQTNVNLSSVRTNISSTPLVTVQHGTAPAPTFCSSLTELATPNGLIDANRMSTGTVSGGLYPGTRDFLNYTSVFGFSTGTVDPGDPDNQGFGFPGDNRTSVTLTVQKNKFIAMKFRAPSANAWSGIRGSYLGQPVAAYSLFAIAPCPGQFASDPNYPMDNNLCRGIAKSSSLSAAIDHPTGSQCVLTKGKTYYFNVIQATGFNNLTNASCSSSSCGVIFNISGFANP
jgi:hypothetical protein